MTRLKQYLKVVKWLAQGRPVPPPHLIKQRMILESNRRHKAQIMIETGTLFGDMVEAMKNHFKQIYSIEISPELAQRAQRRFANDGHVHIIQNDSALALKDLVPKLNQPALFWLDGHYSGGNTGKGDKNTPIMEELTTIFSSDLAHTVLIDDARCFGTEKDYPDLNELGRFIKSMRPNSTITISNDCIQVLPSP